MATKRVLVYGGKGALGQVCVSHFKKQNWWVGSLDLSPNDEADANIIVNGEDQLLQQEHHVVAAVKELIPDQKLDAILCVAGGWAGGNAASADFVKNTDLMVKQSLYSSVLASKLASQFLADGGFLGLTGAKAATDSTPGMIGYGLAKAAVHHLTQSLAAKGGGLPNEAAVVAILPVTLDTPMNRKWMPKADTSTWTPLSFVADKFFTWSDSRSDRPSSGSLVQLITKDGNTELHS